MTEPSIHELALTSAFFSTDAVRYVVLSTEEMASEDGSVPLTLEVKG